MGYVIFEAQLRLVWYLRWLKPKALMPAYLRLASDQLADAWIAQVVTHDWSV